MTYKLYNIYFTFLYFIAARICGRRKIDPIRKKKSLDVSKKFAREIAPKESLQNLLQRLGKEKYENAKAAHMEVKAALARETDCRTRLEADAADVADAADQ